MDDRTLRNRLYFFATAMALLAMGCEAPPPPACKEPDLAAPGWQDPVLKALIPPTAHKCESSVDSFETPPNSTHVTFWLPANPATAGGVVADLLDAQHETLELRFRSNPADLDWIEQRYEYGRNGDVIRVLLIKPSRRDGPRLYEFHDPGALVKLRNEPRVERLP